MFRQGSTSKKQDKKGVDKSQPSIISYFNNASKPNSLNSDLNSKEGVKDWSNKYRTEYNLTISTKKKDTINNQNGKVYNNAEVIDLTDESFTRKKIIQKSTNYNNPTFNKTTESLLKSKSNITTSQTISFTSRMANNGRSIFGGMSDNNRGIFGNQSSKDVYVVSKDPSKPSTNPFAPPKSLALSNNKDTFKKRAMPWGNSKFDNAPVNKQLFKNKYNSNNRNNNQNNSNMANNFKSNVIEKVDPSILSKSQLSVINVIFKKKQNVFFTGSAGTGKSLLLKYIIQKITEEDRKFSDDPNVKFGLGVYASRFPDNLAVTASTGIAAFNLGGCTVHSFAGIGLGQGDIGFLVKKIQGSKQVLNRWIGIKYLIIDEVSMLDGELFDKLEKVARIVRSIPDKPFGGIRLILAGDFFQLPPVSKDSSSKFIFEAKSWKECVENTVVLTEIFRQRDPVFSSILNEARLGNLSPKGVEIFKSLSRPLKETSEGIQGAELFPTRYEVEQANIRRLKTLPGESHFLHARDSGKAKHIVEKLDNYTMFPKVLELKKNAQVMLLRNMGREYPSLVNGSLGIVTGFSEALGDEKILSGKISIPKGVLYPMVRFSGGIEILVTPEESSYEVNNETLATRIQVPLLLSWAMSIHKSQGQTLERVKVDLAKVFEKGQAYVALSRATTLEGLQVLNFRPEKVFAHPKVIHYYNQHLK